MYARVYCLKVFKDWKEDSVYSNKMRCSILSIWLLAVAAVNASDNVINLEPVRQWIEHQSSVQCVTANFVQERRLKALKLPIVNPGKLWFKSPGFFRWQLGEPAESIALQRDDKLLLLRPLKKAGEHYNLEQGNSRKLVPGAVFFSAGFPRSYKGFTENFTVTGVQKEAGSFFFTVKVNDRKAMLALRKIVFQVNATTFYTEGISLRFRDSSSVSTRFSSIRENTKLGNSIFTVDLRDYTMSEGN